MMTTILAQAGSVNIPENLRYYLGELAKSLNDTCWETRVTIIEPLKLCTHLLQCFEVTGRGREIQTLLTGVVKSVEELTQYWQSRADQIPRILSGEDELTYSPSPVAIG